MAVNRPTSGVVALSRCALGRAWFVLLVSGLGGAAGVGTPPAIAALAVPTSAASSSVAVPWVQVDGAWIRPMVPGQTATGGYMTLTASQGLTLLGFKTSVAGLAELHEMHMEGDVMHMRAVPALPLPAGQAVVMRPGPNGHHLMLTGVKSPLKVGEEVEVTLLLRLANGRKVTQKLQVPVRQQP